MQKEMKLSDYLSILLKWKKVLIINLLIVTIVAVVFSFLIPKTYRSTAMLKIAPNAGGGFGGLSSLLSSAGGFASLGADILGISGSSSEDMILGFLYSRTSLENAINEFGLIEYYGVSDSNMDKTLKTFRNDVIFEVNEFGFINVSVIHEDPQIAAEMANYFVGIADSLNTAINVESAKNNREFIEIRYKENLEDLKKAEEDIAKFQAEYGVYAVPEQIEIGLAAAVKLESELFQKELVLKALKNSLSPTAGIVKSMVNQIEAIKEKLKELKSSEKGNHLVIPFDSIPEIQVQYIRKYREFEIQQKVLEFLYPIYEQARIEENRNTPSLLVIDNARPADLKYGPKKAFIILIAFFFTLFLHLPVIYISNRVLLEENSDKNEVEAYLFKIASRFAKIYRIKLSKNK